MAAAIRYALTRLQRLRPYLEHGFLELDNNAAERAMRPIVVGRKNYLFLGSAVGGKAASIAHTLIETAKMNGLDPQQWLTEPAPDAAAAKCPTAVRAADEHRDEQRQLGSDGLQAVSGSRGYTGRGSPFRSKRSTTMEVTPGASISWTCSGANGGSNPARKYPRDLAHTVYAAPRSSPGASKKTGSTVSCRALILTAVTPP